MRPFYLLFILLTALLFIRCAAVPMPATVIPERGNSVEATIYAGNNGLALNALYATKRRTVFNAAFQTSQILSETQAYEFGIGQVVQDSLAKNKALFMVTYGYGKYIVYPFILGATGQVVSVNSTANRLSFYSNFSLGRKTGLIGRLSGYWGHSSQDRVHVDPIDEHAFSSAGIEALFYCVPGKRKHFVMGLGAGVSTGKADYHSDNYDVEKDFRPSPAYLFIGCRLAKNPPSSPLPLSQ